MLLKIGLALSAVAAVFAVVTIALVATRYSSEKPVASSAETTAEEQLALQRAYRERPEPSADEAPAKREAIPEKASAAEAATPEKASAADSATPEEAPGADRATPLPSGNPGWPRPEKGELRETRTFAPDTGSAMTLTLPALGIYDAPVYDSDSPAALDAGIAHVPETSMPWDEGTQRNTYLAAHRLGYPGTGSRLLFYELGKLERGDEVIVEGRGETYRYRVAEKRIVDPSDSWVMGEVRNRDMVTLQTCTPVPTFEKRLIVRADRVEGS